VNTSLRFGRRHALHAVHTAFPFHVPEYAVTGHVCDQFLVAASIALRGVDDIHLPAHDLEIPVIHPEQVAGEQGRFVATGPGPQFHHDISLVIDIFGQEQNLDFLFQCRQAVLDILDFGACEVDHVGITA